MPAAANTGVAGSIAVTVVVSDSVAQVTGDATKPVVFLAPGDLTLTAAADLDSQAVAKAKKQGGDSTGVGASVAVNVVNDTVTAGLADGAVLLSVKDLTISATSKDAMTTTAEGGASAGTSNPAVSAQVAIAISNVTTTAELGTGAGPSAAVPSPSTRARRQAPPPRPPARPRAATPASVPRSS